MKRHRDTFRDIQSATIGRSKEAGLAEEPQEWMTVAEAMGYLRVSRATLYRLSADGRLPYYTVGSSQDRRFRRRDLDAALLPGSQDKGKLVA
jgi:excisionase family DNA binding protein